MDVLPLVSALGISTAIGTTVGTVLSTYFTSGNDRREKRSAVFQHLATLEAKRWVDATDLVDNERNVFAYAQKIRALETSALIAQLPRNVVAHYIVFAQAAHSASASSAASEEYDEVQGYIDARLADAVTRAAAELTNTIWKPRLTRLLQKSRIKKLEQKACREVRKETLEKLDYFAGMQGRQLPKVD